MLRLERLCVQQGTFRLDADLTISKGAVCSVIGPSGAGKSTFLSAVAGFIQPSEGRILWGDRDLTQVSPADRPVTMIFQDNNLFPHLTAAQNVALGHYMRKTKRADVDRNVSSALDRLGLEGLGGRKPGALSGGQQSRVALARAMVQDRPILLLDEPFAALGPGLKAEMVELVRDMAADRGLTVLMITHDPDDARLLGGSTLLILDGEVRPPADTAKILENPPPSLRAYLHRS